MGEHGGVRLLHRGPQPGGVVEEDVVPPRVHQNFVAIRLDKDRQAVLGIETGPRGGVFRQDGDAQHDENLPLHFFNSIAQNASPRFCFCAESSA